jgi:hypothetical protein
MNMSRIENATIKNTRLGQDDGPFTAWISVEGDGWGCSFGGYSFLDKGKPHVFGMQFIQGVLTALECPYWEKLNGMIVRVEMNGGTIAKIGHPIKDKWFDPKETETAKGE